MKKSEQEWAKHVEAIKAQGISAASYAQKHALARSTLYRWQSKLRRAAPENSNAKATTANTQPGKFVAVRIRETPRKIAAPAPATPTATPCTLVLPGNIRLELTTLPTPQWLGELSRSSTLGAH
jgi:lambda repressor-like predicted transcriptional regulator